MRVVLALIASVSTSVAIAETRTTAMEVTLRKRPGEKAAEVGRLPAQTEVTIVREEGRWFLVRANKVEGYLTRTTLTPIAAPATTPPVWGAPRTTLGRELRAEVTSQTASLLSAPDGSVVATLARGAKLAVLDASTRPRWIQVRDDQGKTGWISQASVGDAGATVTARDLPATASTFTRPAPRGRAIGIDVLVGYRTHGMDSTSNAAGRATNYVVDASAAALTIRSSIETRLGARWIAGADATLVGSVASPGIDYAGPTAAPGKIPYRTFDAELGVFGGVHLGEASSIVVRGAGHYDTFLPDDVENVAALAREQLVGVSAGVRVGIVPPRSRISGTLRLDALVVGKRSQTPGLEDGTASTARAIWGGVTFRIFVTPRWSIVADYEAARATTQWSGPSARQADVDNVRRVDSIQLLQIGIGAEL